ncbi:MAG: hypothetical protein K1W24_01255 [Lachnospiraceae bacterium]
MKIKRVLQGTALTALAAAAWMGAGSTDASAAVNPATGVTFDGNSLNITAESDDLEIMTSVAKASGSDNKIKISAWDVYEGNTAKVDLSKLNVTKDSYIAVKTDDMDKPFLVKIAATTKKTKVDLNKETAKINKVTLTEGEATEIQVRTAIGAYGEKAAVSSFDFSNYQYQGASLYVRVPAKITTATKEANQLPSAIKNDETKYDVYSVGSLPGKEAKVNIPKQANGPSVPVDYVKGKVSIPAKTEYRVVVATASALVPSSSAVKVDKKDPKPVSELLNGASKAVVEVRKTATTGKKCASKWTRVEIAAPKTFAEDSITTEFKADAATADAIAKVTTGSSLEIKYTTDKKATKKTGFSIANACSVAFQYYVGDDVNSAADKDIKTLKATTGKANLKKDAAAGKKIWIRVAGDKKSARWAGAWKELGTLPTIS